MSVKGDLVGSMMQALELMGPEFHYTRAGVEELLDRVFTHAGTDRCFVKAAPDEPIFVIRGQDRYAGTIVAIYAVLMQSDGRVPQAKIAEISAWLRGPLQTWQEKNLSRVKVPD